MKIPTSKEVLEHFENVKTVRCLEDGDVYVLDFDQILTILEKSNGRSEIYLHDQIDIPFSGQPSECYLWKESKGFAKIVEFKEESKKQRPNRLEELEKRVEVLEAEKIQNSIINIPLKRAEYIIKNSIRPDFFPEYAKASLVAKSESELLKAEIDELKKEKESLEKINLELLLDCNAFLSHLRLVLGPLEYHKFYNSFFKNKKDA